MHVEVIVDRLKSRFGVEVALKPPRVPYQETIRRPAKAHGRHKKQTGGRGQFGDCHIEIEPHPDGDFEFVDAIKGGVIPQGFIPAVQKGVLEAMAHGPIAGYPLKGVRVTVFDGSYHSVDSSEQAFKTAGAIAMRQAMEEAGAVLLEPIMMVTLSRAGGLRRRRDRRPQLPSRAAAGDGAERDRHDRGQGRGPDGGDAHLRARPARDHRRPGRLHDGVRALRGGPGPSGGQGGRGGGQGGRGRARLKRHAHDPQVRRRAGVPGCVRTLRILPLLLAAPLAAAAPAAAATVASDCAPSAAGTTYAAPHGGYLSARLTGDGDWDLMLRDASSGKRIGGSDGFGGDELVQIWIGAGQKVVAQACRRAGSAPTAQLAFSLVNASPPAGAAATPSLVRVRGTAALLDRLDRMNGLDVTESRGRDWADVLVGGSPALSLLRATGLPFTTRIADLKASYDAARAADRAYTAAVGEGGSPLPSGRTTYRTPEDVQTEFKALVDEHPDLARPVVIGRTFQGREISGVEIAHDVQAHDGRPDVLPDGRPPRARVAVGRGGDGVRHHVGQGRVDAAHRRAAGRRAHRSSCPLVNVDGYVVDRAARVDLADASRRPRRRAVARRSPSPRPAARSPTAARTATARITQRRRCRASCTWGVDNNRNYGNLWGGPGSSRRRHVAELPRAGPALGARDAGRLQLTSAPTR